MVCLYLHIAFTLEYEPDEFKDYVTLLDKGLISNTYTLFKDIKKSREIEALGYDLEELDNKLLFMRLFVSSIANIMIDEREFILYSVPDMNEVSKKMLYKTEGLDIDKIVMSKFIERYFILITDEDKKIEDDIYFREILPLDMGEYFLESYNFNLMWRDIKKTTFFNDSLSTNTPWLDETLPEVSEKINLLNK